MTRTYYSTAPREPRPLGIRIIHVSDRVEMLISRGPELISTYQWSTPMEPGIEKLRGLSLPSRRCPVSFSVAAVERRLGPATHVRPPRQKPGRKSVQITTKEPTP